MASSSRLVPLLVLACWLCAWPAASSLPSADDVMWAKYEQWRAEYRRPRLLGAEETQRRFEVFKSNVEYIEAANRDPTRTYKLGLNQFADMTEEAISATRMPPSTTPSLDELDELITTRAGTVGSGSVSAASSELLDHANLTAPSSVDWRTQGAVSSVQNYNACISSWAFAAAAAIEGITKIKRGKLNPVSAQELIDCNFLCKGCGGCYTELAMLWVVFNGGIATAYDYPYVDEGGSCKSNLLSKKAAVINGLHRVSPNSEMLLALAVAEQPVTASIGTSKDFNFYKSGVFTGPCGTTTDIAVTIVGYGTDTSANLNYWIVKNSWGTTWGDNGYMLLQKNTYTPEGLCGIAKWNFFPYVS